MSAAPTTPDTPRRAPVAGPLFRQATLVDVGGTKRRKLHCLLAAYADAGITNPTTAELADRLGLQPVVVVGLLRRLQADRHIAVRRRKNTVRYKLRALQAQLEDADQNGGAG